MNENNPDTFEEHEALAELDAFEQAWVDELRKPDSQHASTGDTFVQRVMQANEQAQAAPAIAGRVGPRLLPYAAAAAIAMAVYVGWVALTSSNTPDPNTVANNSDNNAVQPDPQTPVNPGVTANKVQLGKLITQAQSTVTLPASRITETARQAPRVLTLNALIDLVDNPVPDLKELLQPLEQDDQQSRA